MCARFYRQPSIFFELNKNFVQIIAIHHINAIVISFLSRTNFKILFNRTLFYAYTFTIIFAKKSIYSNSS